MTETRVGLQAALKTATGREGRHGPATPVVSVEELARRAAGCGALMTARSTSLRRDVA